MQLGEFSCFISVSQSVRVIFLNLRSFIRFLLTVFTLMFEKVTIFIWFSTSICTAKCSIML
jgi:hypothetical protein